MKRWEVTAHFAGGGASTWTVNAMDKRQAELAGKARARAEEPSQTVLEVEAKECR
jgi:hypothetical protein